MADLRYKDSKFIFFSDFDGTITTEDSNDHLTDNLGYGKPKRRQANIDILNNKLPFRDAFKEMIDSVAEKHSFEHCENVVRKNIKLDPGFKTFFDWSKEADVPVVIVSSGMVPIIRAIFENLVGKEDAERIQIISNDADLSQGGDVGQWKVKFRHPESQFGHDKDRCIAEYRALPHPPQIFFAGDGVSDMSAAKSADLLFVKIKPGSGNDLAKHCEREGIRYKAFESFEEVKQTVQAVVEGKLKIGDVGKLGQIDPDAKD